MVLNEQLQQMVQQDIQDAETRPKEEILREQMEGLKTAGRTAGTLAVESIPGVSEALAEKRVNEALQRGDTTGAMIEGAAGLMGVVPVIGDAAAIGLRTAAKKFRKTRKAYKLFVKGEDGELYPLFVDANQPVKKGEFLEANFPDVAFKGKRSAKSEESFYVPTKGAERKPTKYFLDNKEITKREYNNLGSNAKPFARVEPGEKAKGTGDSIMIPDEETRKKLIDAGFITDRTRRTKEAPFGKVTAVAARPGWHSSQSPVATHLGPQDLKVSKKEVDKLLKAGVTKEAIKKRGNQFYVKRRAEDQVFAEVEMADDVDYQSMLAAEGKTDINDRVPKGGSYRYSDGQADSDQWVVGGDMKVNRELSREEAKKIQEELGVKDLPYRDEVEAILGRQFEFNEGGLAMLQGVDDYMLSQTEPEQMMKPKELMMDRGGMAKQMELFDEGGLSKKDEAIEELEEAGAEKLQDRQAKFDELTEMLTSGEVEKMSDEKKADFIKLYKMMRSQGFSTKDPQAGLNEGGLLDEGGMIDEESGNDVPPGSLREEVRDDIPAQLSEGEFVFPADVVRYIGLENLMRMRQEAKQGLAQMDAMGQMGNSEEATMPDDLPFDMYDLDVEEDDGLKMQTGGFVNPQTGTFTMQQPSTFNVQSQVPTYTPPPITPVVQTPTTPSIPTVVPPTVTFPTQSPTTTFVDQIGTTTPGRYDELKTYSNEAGQTLRIPFIGGKPIYPIPAGYTEGESTAAVETTQPTTQPLFDPQQPDRDGREEFDPMTGGTKSTTGGFSLGNIGSSINTNVNDFIETLTGSRPDVMKDPSDATNVTNDALDAIGVPGLDKPQGNIYESAGVTNDFFGGASNITPTSELGVATALLGTFQGLSLSPTGAAAVALGNKANEILGTDFNTAGINFKQASIEGNKARDTALNTLGLVSMSQLDAIDNPEVNDIIGQAMRAGMEASRKGQNPAEAVSSVLSGGKVEALKESIYNDVKSNYNSARNPGMLGLGTYSNADYAADLSTDIANIDVTLGNIGDLYSDEPPTDANKSFRESFKSENPPGSGKFSYGLTAAGTKAKEQLEAVKKHKVQQNVIAKEKAEAEAAAAKEREARQRMEDAIARGRREGREDASPGDRDFDARTGAEAVRDAGGPDRTRGGMDSFYKDGGLAKQMKRSGLASKK